ncbi:MAG: 2-C-methyl-D-erythritol 4-phosphate cytidylyltransferase [Candidatus Latescibacteria bacterium]|nr:2-C-methyl-D-erythritol 4-phosphate cytidylyltransferase [Candidatus Latescibacterota bacterium]
MRAWAVIAAGGSGRRMETNISKQLLKLDGATILERTLKPFMNNSGIDGIIIVAAEEIIEHINSIISAFPNELKNISIIKGGSERQDSVWNGLCAVPDDVEIIVIHDAVRPFITSKLITECIDSAFEHGAVTVMRPLKETVKVVSNGVIVNTPDRSSLWSTQTPQAFRTELICEAHSRARAEGFTGTDDCMLVERLGHPVHIIEGDDFNIKITTQSDMKIAEVILNFLETGRKNA